MPFRLVRQLRELSPYVAMDMVAPSWAARQPLCDYELAGPHVHPKVAVAGRKDEKVLRLSSTGELVRACSLERIAPATLMEKK